MMGAAVLTLRGGATRTRRRALAGIVALAPQGMERSGPPLIVTAIVAGLAFVSVVTPIAGRGDYGQWLMASRYYLGLSVPAYRSIGELPPLVPILMAGLQLVVRDPVIALQLITVAMLAGAVLSFYLAGAILLGSRVGGLLSVILAFLVTDRLLELLAFGGLFQLAAIACLNVSVGAFARAGDGGGRARAWWGIGAAGLVGLALSHIGTATVGLPIGLAVATISVIRLRRLGWRSLLASAAPLLIALLGLAAYAVTVLAPASGDYVSNPASLAYRGPDRLISSLLTYWPTALVVLGGGAAAVIGAAAEALHRTLGRAVVLLVWSAGAWGSVVAAIITGTGTDYPRFATVLVAPLAVAAAAVVLRLTNVAAWNLQAGAFTRRRPLVTLVAAGTLAIVAIPFAVVRYEEQMATYQPVDAAALTAAVDYVDSSLGSDPGAVLTAVRDGKWLEGLSGREALFSLPVRFAVRPSEWQRSVDADTILRSSLALTNQFFFVKLSDPAIGGVAVQPTAMTIAMNHGGEFVDVLQLRQADTQLVGASRTWMAEAGPAGSTTTVGPAQATYETAWRQQAGAASASFSRTITALDQGSTLAMVDSSPGYTIQSVLRPASGMAFTSATIEGQSARICLSAVGAAEPCLQLYVSQPDAAWQVTSAGLSVHTTVSTQLSLYLTDLTGGAASVGLAVIDPAAAVAQHDVKAAILLDIDPAYGDRRSRLQALGFEVVQEIGPYAVLRRP
jgi:hypothetical protein